MAAPVSPRPAGGDLCLLPRRRLFLFPECDNVLATAPASTKPGSASHRPIACRSGRALTPARAAIPIPAQAAENLVRRPHHGRLDLRATRVHPTPRRRPRTARQVGTSPSNRPGANLLSNAGRQHTLAIRRDPAGSIASRMKTGCTGRADPSRTNASTFPSLVSD